ncbi:hypothetical protein GCM10008931_11260 [Oceanobacillus oncorhynchi subsp. oncorhynchi]
MLFYQKWSEKYTLEKVLLINLQIVQILFTEIRGYPYIKKAFIMTIVDISFILFV